MFNTCALRISFHFLLFFYYIFFLTIEELLMYVWFFLSSRSYRETSIFGVGKHSEQRGINGLCTRMESFPLHSPFSLFLFSNSPLLYCLSGYLIDSTQIKEWTSWCKYTEYISGKGSVWFRERWLRIKFEYHLCICLIQTPDTKTLHYYIHVLIFNTVSSIFTLFWIIYP